MVGDDISFCDLFFFISNVA